MSKCVYVRVTSIGDGEDEGERGRGKLGRTHIHLDTQEGEDTRKLESEGEQVSEQTRGVRACARVSPAADTQEERRREGEDEGNEGGNESDVRRPSRILFLQKPYGNHCIPSRMRRGT